VPTLEVQRLTENEAFDANPVFTTDGAWIYFESDRTGDHEIWRLPADGGVAEQITRNRAFDSAPDPLPGGGVVFESDRAGAKDIWLLAPGADAPVPLTSGPDEDGSPAVSPDGTRVVFESNRGKAAGADLWLVDLDDLELHRVTHTPSGVYVRTADWSPDGKRLVFESNVSGGSALHIVSAEGGELDMLMAFEGYEGHPAWSPDGELVAFESTRGGTMEIHLVPADGGTPEQLTDSGGYWPQWSPDGRVIVYGLPTATEPEVGTVKILR
jgi:TolB protein